jgi:alkylation response protein AidB-like acyl-CoA dehydrogenase
VGRTGRLPYFLLAAACFAGTAVGILRSALGGSVELMGGKSSSITGASHYDQPRVKEVVANADAAVRALRAGMRQSTAEVSEAAEAGPEIPHAIRARLYASALYTMDTARLAVSDLYARSSSVAYASRNPVERSLREIHALAAALDSGPFRPVQMAAGRVLLGHSPGPVPQF